MRNLLIVLSFSIATTLLASAEQFKVPATTKLGFSIMKFKIQDAVQGKFGALNGTYKFDAATNKLVDINVTIDVNSIDTSDEKRDGHLKTDPDFFNTAKIKDWR
ncbi:MAG: YceI family protein [Halobacteriovoraceae bacterium]|nr:YceI family protein [Halobacteriovoraceae bacterium]MCB9093480.1 YceI family protein [Halobacteriovoraceae bacterium]